MAESLEASDCYNLTQGKPRFYLIWVATKKTSMWSQSCIKRYQKQKKPIRTLKNSIDTLKMWVWSQRWYCNCISNSNITITVLIFGKGAVFADSHCRLFKLPTYCWWTQYAATRGGREESFIPWTLLSMLKFGSYHQQIKLCKVQFQNIAKITS